MPKWITTKWATFDFGWSYKDNTEHKEGFFGSKRTSSFEFQLSPNYTRLQEKLNWLADDPDFAGYEIKSVTPLTTSLAEYDAKWWKGGDRKGGYGWGYGYGISQITGMAVLLQKIEDVSEKEYKYRTLIATKKELEISLPKLKAAIEANAWINTNIVEKKPIFGSMQYHVDDHRQKSNKCHEFKTRQDAEAHVQTILAELAIPKTTLDNVLKEIEELEKEFTELEQS